MAVVVATVVAVVVVVVVVLVSVKLLMILDSMVGSNSSQCSHWQRKNEEVRKKNIMDSE